MEINAPPKKEKCDMAEFGHRTTSHSLTEPPKPKSKDYNMTDLNTDTPATATLTAKQLFNRFVDAPLRNVPRSTLVPSKPDDYGAWEGYVGFHYGVLSEEIPDEIREAVCESDDPASELTMFITDLEALTEGLKLMFCEYLDLCETTEVDEPSEDSTKGEWNGEPRYILPEMESGKEVA